VERAARRYPVAFLGDPALVGVAAARYLRSSDRRSQARGTSPGGSLPNDRVGESMISPSLRREPNSLSTGPQGEIPGGRMG